MLFQGQDQMKMLNNLKEHLQIKKVVMLAKNIERHKQYILRATETMSITKEWLRNDTAKLRKLVEILPKEKLLSHDLLVRYVK